jgi:hypothetical protein
MLERKKSAYPCFSGFTALIFRGGIQMDGSAHRPLNLKVELIS